MEWDVEEKRKINAAFDKAIDSGSIDSAAVAAGTCAVELAATRGGTMASEELDYAFQELSDSIGLYSGSLEKYRDEDEKHHAAIRQHAAAQGATVATLKAEIARLKATMDALDCTRREGGDTRHCRVESPCLRCECDAKAGMVTALQANDHTAMEQLAHALGWKDGGPGWQAAIDAVKELATARELAQSYLDAASTTNACGDEETLSPGALKSRLAEDRATIARLTAAGQALSEHADRTAGEPT